MGFLDEVFRDVSESLVNLFVDTPVTLTRTVATYNSDTNTESVSEDSVSVKASPPFPFNVRDIDNKAVLAQDLMILIPAKTLEDQNFDPVPDSDTTVIIKVGGRDYSVVKVKKFTSGDQVALYEMQIR